MKEYYHRHLPHWQPTGVVFFITFRLKGSLPYEAIKALREEREREKIEAEKSAQDQSRKQNYLDERNYFGRWDTLLDKAEFGPCWLSQPEVAKIVKEALMYRDEKVFDLYAFCIMSNHVHLVIKPCRSERYSNLQMQSNQSDHQPDILPLHKIMQSLKRHTARQANIVLGRDGAFWQDESYDHVVRDNDEFICIVHYVLENPVKAGLVSKWEDWRWSYCKDGIL